MEYGRIKPLEGVNGYVPTAFTKKSIKEMLEEEAKALAAEGDTEKAQAAQALCQAAPIQTTCASRDVDGSQGPTALANTWLQQPPHMRAEAPAGVDVIARIHEREQYTPKPRSFLRRLIGG